MAPWAPLCKGSCHEVTEGLLSKRSPDFNNPPLSPLCTRGQETEIASLRNSLPQFISAHRRSPSWTRGRSAGLFTKKRTAEAARLMFVVLSCRSSSRKTRHAIFAGALKAKKALSHPSRNLFRAAKEIRELKSNPARRVPLRCGTQFVPAGHTPYA